MVSLEVLRLDHVGIAGSRPTALALALAMDPRGAQEMPSGVTVTRFGPDRSLEWVTPRQPGSPVDRFLKNRGPGLHHIALTVDGSLTNVRHSLGRWGLEPVGPIEPSSDGRPSLFLHPRTTGGVLVELIEDREDKR